MPLLCKRLDVMDPYRGKKAPLEVAAPKQVFLGSSGPAHKSHVLLPTHVHGLKAPHTHIVTVSIEYVRFRWSAHEGHCTDCWCPKAPSHWRGPSARVCDPPSKSDSAAPDRRALQAPCSTWAARSRSRLRASAARPLDRRRAPGSRARCRRCRRAPPRYDIRNPKPSTKPNPNRNPTPNTYSTGDDPVAQRAEDA